jgi:hypothetical protein
LCPKWTLEVSRFDVLRKVGEEFEFTLAELLPFAPTDQRSQNVWTAYNPANRHYTVAVQDYPGTGLDTFFVVEINEDITSATPVISNVVVGHPDGKVGDAGKMTLSKIFLDAAGNTVVLFEDGSLYSLDLATKSYVLLANIHSGGSLKEPVSITKAQILENNILRSVLYDSKNYVSYLVRTDLSTSPPTVSAPLQLQPLRGTFAPETPFAAHFIVDPNTKVSNLAILYHGNFDQILAVDETTGVQTEIMNDVNADQPVPIEFQCDAPVKECDYLWSTTAYDPASNKIYFQIHQVTDESNLAYIYNVAYYENRATEKWYPIADPNVQMTFGYYGYQFINFPSAKKQ